MDTALVTDNGAVRVKGVFDGDKDGAGQPEHLAFAEFNGGPHLCVEVDGHATITVNLPTGKQITFAFVPASRDSGGEHECVDIRVHGCMRMDNSWKQDGSNMIPAHHVIGFHGGSDRLSSRQLKMPVSLTAILLNPSHYQEPKNAG